MSDEAAFALAWTVMPGASARPAPPPANPTQALLSARRDPHGIVTVWPNCSLSGSGSALAQVVDPIDPLDPEHDSGHLIVTHIARTHQAQVLAMAAREARLRES